MKNILIFSILLILLGYVTYNINSLQVLGTDIKHLGRTIIGITVIVYFIDLYRKHKK